jgi:hypothetical protein
MQGTLFSLVGADGYTYLDIVEQTGTLFIS